MIIYGAGDIGEMADLYYSCFENIEFYLDTFKSGVFGNHKIENTDILERMETSKKIVVCSHAWREIADMLEKKGFTNIYVFRVMTNIKSLDFNSYWIDGVIDAGCGKVLEKFLIGKKESTVSEKADVVISVGNKAVRYENYIPRKKHAYFYVLIEKYSEIKEADMQKGLRKKLYFSGGRSINWPIWFVIDNESKDCLVQSIKDDTDICSELNDLLNFINTGKGGTIIDCGANIGGFALPFAAEGFNVVAIEAGKKNCECLRRAALINHFNIVVVEKAVWDKDGRLFFCEDGVSGFASESECSIKNGDEVECICLDSLEKYLGGISEVCMIKIDVEGAEIRAISGGKAFLQRTHYPPIYCESNKVTLIREKNRVKTLFEEMLSVGYDPYILIHDKLQRVDVSDIQARTVQDYIFVHKSDRRLKTVEMLPPMDREEKISILREELNNMPPEYVKAQRQSLEYYEDYRKMI